MESNLLSITTSVLALIVALLALYVTWRIPYQIMINQRYADLLSEYRSIEMGNAIFFPYSIFSSMNVKINTVTSMLI